MKTEQEIKDRISKINFMLDATNELGIYLNSAKRQELNNERYYLRWVTDEQEESDNLDEIVREGQIIVGTVKYDVLETIRANPDSTAREIAQLINKDTMSVQVILRELFFRKLVKREGTGVSSNAYRYFVEKNDN